MGKAEELPRHQQNAVGGFGPVRLSSSEVESTAIAVLAHADLQAIAILAADATAARVMGVDPDGVLHIAEAGRFLGQSDPDRISLVAEDLPTFESSFAPAPASDGESVD